MGLRRAIAKRPIDAEQINGLLSKTLRQIENEFDGEVPSRAIADAIMLRLKNVDGVAWLRYASFYEDFMGISQLLEELVNLGGEIRGDKTADKKDDYTRLQNLNALVSVIGSLSTREETLQLQRTLSFLRDNDESMRMPTKSFEHCVEQVVGFTFQAKDTTVTLIGTQEHHNRSVMDSSFSCRVY